jgi:positive regulator of sigma E activity
LIVIFLPFLPGFPLLFIDASGVTLINQAIYVIVIAVFIVGSFLFMMLFVHSKSSARCIGILCVVAMGYWHIWRYVET